MHCWLAQTHYIVRAQRSSRCLGPNHAAWRPAAEKRQGTKSRWVRHPAVQQALWGLHSALWTASGQEAATRMAERFHNFRVSA